MTVLFSTDCESYADGTQLTNFSNSNGNGMLVLVTSGFSQSSVSGTKSYGRQGPGDSAVYTGSGPIGNTAIRSAGFMTSLATGRFVGHILRASDSTNSNLAAYRSFVQSDGTNLTLQLIKYVSGSTVLASFTTNLAPGPTDVIHFESKMIGTTLEARVWLNSTARPSAAMISVVDADYATGYPGFIANTDGAFTFADEIVITDGAGGEDFFYPEGTVNLTAASTTQDATSGTGAVDVPGVHALAGAGTSQSSTSGTGAVTGPGATITPTQAFGNNSRSLWANMDVTVFIHRESDNVLLATKNLTTDSTAHLAGYSDASFVAAVNYRNIFVFANGAEGMETLAAA